MQRFLLSLQTSIDFPAGEGIGGHYTSASGHAPLTSYPGGKVAVLSPGQTKGPVVHTATCNISKSRRDLQAAISCSACLQSAMRVVE